MLALVRAADSVLGALDALLVGACRVLRLRPVSAAAMVWSAACHLVISVLKVAACIGKAALALLTALLALALAPLALLASVVQLATAIPAALALLAASIAAAAVLARYVTLPSTARAPAAMRSTTTPQPAWRGTSVCRDCPICQDPIQQQEVFTLSSCGHQYCTPCLLRYARLRFQAGQQLLCALCRGPYSSPDIQTLRRMVS